MSMWSNIGTLLKENPLVRAKRSSDQEKSSTTTKTAKREALEDISNHPKRGLIKVDRSIKIIGKSKPKTTEQVVSIPDNNNHTKPTSSVSNAIPAQPIMPSTETLNSDDYVYPQHHEVLSIVELKADEKAFRSSGEMEEDLMEVEEEEQGLPFEVQNIDDDPSDLQQCSEYVKEIYQNLKVAEKRYMPIDYLPHQPDINSQMRAILIDWLVEVSEEYKLSPESLFLTINFLDRYLSCMVISRSKLQLLGISCMFVASKFEEVHPPTVNEFVYISDYTYKKEEIFDLEASVLNTLHFQLSAPSAKHFLRRYLKAAGGDANVSVLANYLAQLSLIEYSFVRYLPSQVALCSVVLALHSFGYSPWTPTLAHYTGASWDSPQLKSCLDDLYKFYVAVCQPDHMFKAVKEKYSQSKFGRIANHPPPSGPPRL